MIRSLFNISFSISFSLVINVSFLANACWVFLRYHFPLTIQIFLRHYFFYLLMNYVKDLLGLMIWVHKVLHWSFTLLIASLIYRPCSWSCSRMSQLSTGVVSKSSTDVVFVISLCCSTCLGFHSDLSFLSYCLV